MTLIVLPGLYNASCQCLDFKRGLALESDSVCETLAKNKIKHVSFYFYMFEAEKVTIFIICLSSIFLVT